MRGMMSMALILAALAFTGCARMNRGGEALTAGENPILQMQIGAFFGSSNTRPVQEYDPAGGNPSKIAETIEFGDMTVDTHVTVTSGGGSSTTQTDSGDQAADIPVTTDVEADVGLAP